MAKLLKTLRDAIGLAADLSELKFTVPITGVSAVLGAVGHFGFEWPLTPVILLAVLLTLLCVLLVAFIRATRGLDRWRGHGAYTIWIAAWLWIDSTPRSPKIAEGSPAYPALQLIKNAIIIGAIKPISGTGNMKSTVSEKDLRQLAQVHNVRPRFLFP